MVSAMKASETQVGGTHYKDMGAFQPWDVLQHWLTPEEYRGYQKGVAIAYLARERGKGGDQDIRKAAHHLNKLVEVLDAAEAQHAATAPVVFPGQPEYSPDEVALAFGIYPGAVRMAESFGASLAALDVVAANAADDGWIEWGGGECPVPVGTPVEVRHRGGAKYDGFAGRSNGVLSEHWRVGQRGNPSPHPCDIIAYRVVRAA